MNQNMIRIAAGPLKKFTTNVFTAAGTAKNLKEVARRFGVSLPAEMR